MSAPLETPDAHTITNVVAIPVTCEQVVLDDLYGGSVLGMGILRKACVEKAQNYSVEAFNAALNDLMRRKRISMHGLNSFVINDNG